MEVQQQDNLSIAFAWSIIFKIHCNFYNLEHRSIWFTNVRAKKIVFKCVLFPCTVHVWLQKPFCFCQLSNLELWLIHAVGLLCLNPKCWTRINFYFYELVELCCKFRDLHYCKRIWIFICRHQLFKQYCFFKWSAWPMGTRRSKLNFLSYLSL